jgi:hypothetical protein
VDPAGRKARLRDSATLAALTEPLPTVVASRVVASQKRSISFDESVLAEAERQAAATGGNLSAFVNAAVLRELRIARGLKLLAEDEEQFGPVPDDVRAQIAATWPD